MTSFSIVLLTVKYLFVAICSAAPQDTKLSMKIPEECGLGFCSIRPEGYDEIEEKMNKLLTPYLNEVGDRKGEAKTYFVPETDKDNCRSKVTTERPFHYLYKDLNDATKVDIIVQTELFPQTYDNIKCVSELNDNGVQENVNQECFKELGLISNLNFNMKYRCQETQGVRSLLIYDPDKHGIVSKNYSITVCCSCKITSSL